MNTNDRLFLATLFIVFFSFVSCLLTSVCINRSWEKDAIQRGYGVYHQENSTSTKMFFKWKDELNEKENIDIPKK